jgi:4-carboxymuconolactone decarboxylase
VAIALLAWLAYAVPHTVYHLFNLEPFETGDAVANVLALAATVVLPAALLVLLARPGRVAGRRGSAPGPSNGNARIAGVPERTRNPFVRMAYRSSRRQTGTVVDPIKIFAHHPTILAGYGALETAAQHSHRVDKRITHLAETRAAMLAGCEWCLDFASGISEEAGVSEDDLRELPTYATSDRFSDTEKLALDYATGISRTPVDVPDELFDRLRERFDEGQLVELTALIALENFRARFNWAFGIGGQGFSEGAYCVRPEAPVPAGAS